MDKFGEQQEHVLAKTKGFRILAFGPKNLNDVHLFGNQTEPQSVLNITCRTDHTEQTATSLPRVRTQTMTSKELMQRIDELLSHVWMVRTFLKHSEEAAEDDELAEVHRELYDYMLALGAAWKAEDADEYLRVAKKKFSKLRRITQLFVEIQPEVSGHTNFQMASRSLQTAVREIQQLLEVATQTGSASEASDESN